MEIKLIALDLDGTTLGLSFLKILIVKITKPFI